MRLDLISDHRRRGRRRGQRHHQAAAMGAARGEKFDHCVLGEPSNVKRSATPSRSAAAARNPARSIVDGIQGHVAYPHRASNPVPDIAKADRGAERRTARQGQRAIPGLEPRIHLGRCRQCRQQRDSGQARAKFNIRFNDPHPGDVARAGRAARWPTRRETASARGSCGSVERRRFLTSPGPFTDSPSRRSRR